MTILSLEFEMFTLTTDGCLTEYREDDMLNRTHTNRGIPLSHEGKIPLTYKIISKQRMKSLIAEGWQTRGT